MLPVFTAINPIRGGKKAPPTMAITINELPIFVFGPIPLIPNAKIVGNINDIKKLVMNNDINPTQPGSTMAISISTILIIPYSPISRLGFMKRMMYVAENLPNAKATNVPVRK
jgi:hypothetical protein